MCGGLCSLRVVWLVFADCLGRGVSLWVVSLGYSYLDSFREYSICRILPVHMCAFRVSFLDDFPSAYYLKSWVSYYGENMIHDGRNKTLDLSA